MKTEDVIFIISMLALAALVIWKLPTRIPDEVSDNPNARDTVGASNEPTNTNPAIGPRYLVYNTPWLLDPTIARFVAEPVSRGMLGKPQTYH